MADYIRKLYFQLQDSFSQVYVIKNDQNLQISTVLQDLSKIIEDNQFSQPGIVITQFFDKDYTITQAQLNNSQINSYDCLNNVDEFQLLDEFTNQNVNSYPLYQDFINSNYFKIIGMDIKDQYPLSDQDISNIAKNLVKSIDLGQIDTNLLLLQYLQSPYKELMNRMISVNNSLQDKLKAFKRQEAEQTQMMYEQQVHFQKDIIKGLSTQHASLYINLQTSQDSNTKVFISNHKDKFVQPSSNNLAYNVDGFDCYQFDDNDGEDIGAERINILGKSQLK